MTVPSTSSFAAAIPAPLSSLMPPYVTSISHPALVKWTQERREYEDVVEARRAATGEDKDKGFRSVENSFYRNLLTTLCKFEWNTTLEAITDEQIVAVLDKIVDNVMNDAVVNVDLVLGNKLKMDLRERDVKARVINYFMLCNEIIMQYGLANIFATTMGMKEKCRLLKQHLEPSALRDMVDAHHRLVDNSSKSDDHALYLLVKNKAGAGECIPAKRKKTPQPSMEGANLVGVRSMCIVQRKMSNVSAKDRRSDEDEVLVGKSLLAELGIDVDRQLEFLACREVDDYDLFDDPDRLQACKPTVGDIVTNVRTFLFYGGWRLELWDDPPARVPPLKIRLEPNAPPYRCKVRQYSPEKSEFLTEFNQKLVSLGGVYQNRASRWCCPVLPLRKPGTDKFRQTNDSLPLNAVTEQIAGVMPSLEVALVHFKEKMFYAVFVFVKGFWQLLFDESCQEFMSYMTDKGIFTRHVTSVETSSRTWEQLKQQLSQVFAPPYRVRSRFLATRQGKKELVDYVQELRTLITGMAVDPVPEAITVTVFMKGLRKGVARKEVFRVHPTSFEEGVNVALNPEFNFKSSRLGWNAAYANPFVGHRSHGSQLC
ncbi:unnamed protein product [Phytophthora fragariaefolia]|uniref:Unnamed protein product n=1 Tax=Phytophthora fragariaefolia TaxID=1490495 RepID=A0A9W7DA57_9STRA|nr:unnamed protein product [Phytophthora fragariaefolia]